MLRASGLFPSGLAPENPAPREEVAGWFAVVGGRLFDEVRAVLFDLGKFAGDGAELFEK